MHNESPILSEICRKLERYAPPAFDFLRQGLDFTVQKLHGPPDPTLERFARHLRDQGVEPSDLPDLIESDSLPDAIEQLIEQFGGALEVANKMNRHVSGAELCVGLRDYALTRWGLMAPAVLNSWGIRQTRDFGRMVFALVENGVLQKQPEDRIEDFNEVYPFDTAFDAAYKIRLSDPKTIPADVDVDEADEEIDDDVDDDDIPM